MVCNLKKKMKVFFGIKFLKKSEGEISEGKKNLFTIPRIR